MTTIAPATIATKIENGTLTITVEGFPPIEIDPSALPESLIAQAALHGLKQKYVDRGALGAGATRAMKHAAIIALVEHHAEGGDWNMGSTAGSGTGSGAGLLIQALVALTGSDIATIRETIGTLDKTAQAAMRKRPEVAAEIARVKAERPTRAPKNSAADDAARLALLRLTAA